MEQLLRSRRVDELLANSPPQPVTCDGVQGDLDPQIPLCSDATAGELRDGYEYSRFQGEGIAVDRRDLDAHLLDWLRRTGDDDSAPDITAASIGCALVGEQPDCRTEVAFVFVRGEEFLYLAMNRADTGVLRLTKAATGLTALNANVVSGGDVLYAVQLTGPGGPTRFMPLGSR